MEAGGRRGNGVGEDGETERERWRMDGGGGGGRVERWFPSLSASFAFFTLQSMSALLAPRLHPFLLFLLTLLLSIHAFAAYLFSVPIFPFSASHSLDCCLSLFLLLSPSLALSSSLSSLLAAHLLSPSLPLLRRGWLTPA